MGTLKNVGRLGVVCLILLAGPAAIPAEGLDGFQGARIGMRLEQVLAELRSQRREPAVMTARHFMSRPVRDNRLFRHADYRFDDDGVLREIALTMREVLGRKEALKLFNTSYKMKVSPDRSVVRDGLVISVQGNKLLIRSADWRAIETASTGARIK